MATDLRRSLAVRLPAPPALRPLPNVLYAANLNPSLKFGTVEEQIVHLCRAFRAEGRRLVPLFFGPTRHGTDEPFTERGVPIEFLELGSFRWSRLQALAQLVTRHEIDVVHWHFTAALHNPYLWGLTALRPDVRHILTDHDSRPTPLPPAPALWKRSLKGLLMRRYRSIWGVSQFVVDCLRTHGMDARAVCSRHFVNTERFRPDPAVRTHIRQRLGADEHFVVLCVGQLIPEKGIDVLIRAVAELPERVVLWVVGAGNARDELRRLIAELGLETRVQLLGLQWHVEPYMQTADCFACPSQWAEAAGLVNLEATSCGLPLVASRIGGIPEYVEDGRAGILVTPGDPRELAAALRRLAEDPALCRQMSAAARTLAEERFSAPAVLPGMLDLYRAVTG